MPNSGRIKGLQMQGGDSKGGVNTSQNASNNPKASSSPSARTGVGRRAKVAPKGPAKSPSKSEPKSGPVVLSQRDYQELMAVLQTYERLAQVDPDTTQRMRLMERMHRLREGVFNRIFPVFVAGYCANLCLFGGLILADRLLLPLAALWTNVAHVPLLEPEIILSVIAATVAQSAAFVLGMGRWLFPAKG